MAKCYICGAETSMFYLDRPICVKCDDKIPGKEKIEKREQERKPKPRDKDR